jgi:hypothetical protein
MRILDATCGFKDIWYQKNHPFVTFMDKKKENIIRISDNTKLKDRRYWKCNQGKESCKYVNKDEFNKEREEFLKEFKKYEKEIKS